VQDLRSRRAGVRQVWKAMNFIPLGASDARLIELVVHADARGDFARTWCAKSFAEQGIDFHPVQANTSVTRLRGVVRGMHFQRAPKADAKIVRCTLGRIHDIIVDLREQSSTRGQIYVNELAADIRTMLYVPAGFAHGFQTRSDHAVVEYLMGVEYVSELYDGFRHDDPSIGIVWPEPVAALSATDAGWPALVSRMPWLSE
jgi:dTDP-4-dehydrorhamnose 3,5-epimerase